MLGWEYPPRFAGGLGKACRGISQALAKQGGEIVFVLPSFPGRVEEPHLEVVGAHEVLIEAGWDPGFEVQTTVNPAAASAPPADFTQQILSSTAATEAELEPLAGEGTPRVAGGIRMVKSEAKLYPYGAHPTGPMPERIVKMIERMMEAEPSPLKGTRLGGRKRVFLRQEKGMKQPLASPPPETKEIYGRNLWSEIEKFCFTVRHMAENHEVDVIHAHDWMTFPAAFEAHRATGAPVFLHVHATEYDRSGDSLDNDVFRIEREGFRRATHIFAVSRYTAGVIERLYGVPRRKISVIYNAPDDDEKDVIASPDEPREPQVVFLGRLTFQKGPDHFLEAAALVARVHPEARFLFCGTGDMMDKLRQQAHRLGIENRVHFAGFVDPNRVDEILGRSRVLVMPSVSEPFGLVALEAIRCGIPVIISKQSGVREVLPRALQVDFWDHEKLADQMAAALRLRDLSRQLVSEGMDLIQQLSWEKSALKVLESYRQHLGSTYFQAIEGAHGH